MRQAATSAAKAERNKRIFELRESYGLTHAAIAERLGLSTSLRHSRPTKEELKNMGQIQIS